MRSGQRHPVWPRRLLLHARSSVACLAGRARRWSSGIVGVNEGLFSNEVVPFGGVKDSGLGYEGAAEGLTNTSR